jgi:hypothetical protein
LASLLAKANWRRRRSRLVTRTLAAAAAAAGPRVSVDQLIAGLP